MFSESEESVSIYVVLSGAKNFLVVALAEVSVRADTAVGDAFLTFGRF
jgi:hypothetical protein